MIQPGPVRPGHGAILRLISQTVKKIRASNIETQEPLFISKIF